MLSSYIPHFLLTAVVIGGAFIFLHRGHERRDLLAMGFAALSAGVWMISVTMADIRIEAGELPTFWIAVGNGALPPTLFFVLLSVLLLEHYYHPDEPVPRRLWLPLAVATLALLGIQIANPEFFIHSLGLAEPRTDRVELQTRHQLTFSPGAGYYLFLGLLGYASYQIAKRFPRILQAMQLPEAERRTRMLLALALTAAFWGVALEIVPTLLSRQAPGFLRLVGAALAMGGAVYALVLSRAFEPASLLRNGIFYVMRIALVAAPTGYLLIGYRQEWTGLEAGQLALMALVAVIIVDYASQFLRPWFDRLAMRKTYRSIEAVNMLVHELLHLRDLSGLSRMLQEFFRDTMGVSDVRLLSLSADGSRLVDPATGESLPIDDALDSFLCERSGTMAMDIEIDPRLFPIQDTLRSLFRRLGAQVVLPLVDQGQLQGLLILGVKESADPYYVQDLEFLDRIRNPVALALFNTLLYESSLLGRSRTALLRPAAFFAVITNQGKQAERYGAPVSLGILRFEGGRETLAALHENPDLAPSLYELLRGSDVLGWLGDDTIGVLTPYTDTASAREPLERITKALSSHLAGAGTGAWYTTITPLHGGFDSLDALLDHVRRESPTASPQS